MHRNLANFPRFGHFLGLTDEYLLNRRVNYDSVRIMRGNRITTRQQLRLPTDQLKQGGALLLLLVLTGLAIAGPTGLLAWSENSQLLEQRQAQISALTEKRDALKNRVELLDPEAADPDLIGELLREQNVVHADELVVTIEEE